MTGTQEPPLDKAHAFTKVSDLFTQVAGPHSPFYLRFLLALGQFEQAIRVEYSTTQRRKDVEDRIVAEAMALARQTLHSIGHHQADHTQFVADIRD